MSHHNSVKLALMADPFIEKLINDPVVTKGVSKVAQAVARSLNRGQRHIAEDYMQEAYIKIILLFSKSQKWEERRAKWEESIEPQRSAYIQRITRTAIIDYFRRELIPKQIQAIHKKIEQARRTLTQHTGQSPSDHDIADYLDMSIEELHMSMMDINTAREPASLDSTNPQAKVDDPSAWGLNIPDQDIAGEYRETIEDQLVQDATAEELRQAILQSRLLTDQERTVLDLFFENSEIDRPAVEKEIGVSESRLSQIRTRAIHNASKALLGLERREEGYRHEAAKRLRTRRNAA